MKHRFEEEGLPGCATCHGSHKIQLPSDKMVGMRDGAVCMKCHENGKYGATLAGADAAREIRHGLDQLNQQIATAETTLAKAEQLGMEVSEPKFELRNAVNALTNARTLLHSFQVKPVEAALADGEKVAAEVQGKADHALAGTYPSEGMAGRVAGAHLDRHRHVAPLHSHAARRQAVTLRPTAKSRRKRARRTPRNGGSAGRFTLPHGPHAAIVRDPSRHTLPNRDQWLRLYNGLPR